MKFLHVSIIVFDVLLIQNVHSNFHNYLAWKVNRECEAKTGKQNYTQAAQGDFSPMEISDITNKEEQSRQWYLKLPVLPVLFATSPTLPHGQCKQQAQKYLEGLSNGTLWAIRMFDSSTKYPEGIIAGHTRHYGNFDECYQIGSTVKSDSSERDAEVTGGKYCLVKVTYQKLNAFNDNFAPMTLDFDPNESVWEAVKERGDFRRIKRYSLELALCVPDACSASDIEKALDKPLRTIADTLLIFSCIILGLVSLVGLGTWYDVSVDAVAEKDDKSLSVDVLLCFSVRRSFSSITEIKYNHQGLDCFHLIRFIAMCFSISYHRLLQYFSNPTINTEFLENGYTSPIVLVFMNTMIFIEFFLTFGGILRAYNMLRELDEKKRMNFWATILTRYLRFTPLYFIIVVFIALVLPHLGSGPYWESKIGLDSKSCAENWWTNILYINNYVNTDKLCMFQSWYVTVDYHLHILASFVIYFFWKMPRKIGYLFLIGIVITGSAIQFYFAYIHNIQPMLILTHPNMHEIKEDLYFTTHYIKTHEHFNVYFIGILGGAIIHDHRLSPWRISGPWKHFPFKISTISVIFMTLIMGIKYHNPNVIPTPLENALYGVSSKLIVAMITVIVAVYMSVSDESEFCHKISKPRWVQPLAKLTYGAYLVHSIHQSYDLGVTRNARTFSIHNVVRDLVVDIVFSFSFAFILTMLIEEPFRKIEKRLITKRSHNLKSGDEPELLLTKKST